MIGEGVTGWLNHPRFVPIRRSVTSRLREHSGYFRRAGVVIFLCGARNSERRDYLAAYLRKNPRYNVFYAETVWTQVSQQNPDGNALDLESRLASFADVVVLIAESAGTFCELGAFALSQPLRLKLLPILDHRYEAESSFLATGPVRWVNAESRFAPCMWLDLDRILLQADEIDRRLAKVPKEPNRRGYDIRRDPRLVLLFLVDLITVFGPCTKPQVAFLVIEVLGDALKEIDYDMLLGLAVSLSMLRRVEEFYYREVRGGKLEPFQRPTKSVNILGLRAEVVSVMQVIPSSMVALGKMGSGD